MSQTSNPDNGIRQTYPVPALDTFKQQSLPPDDRMLLADIRDRFVYHPDGVFLYAKPVASAHKKIGDIVGCPPDPKRVGGTVYHRITVRAKNYHRARLVWFWHHFEWPTDTIDHINGVHTDDRIENLRLATRSEQSLNTALRRSNTSGHRGVSWHKRANRWQVSMSKKGVKIPTRSFPKDQLAEAVAYRKELEETYAAGIIRR